MLDRKNKVVKELTQGVEFLFRKNKVDRDQGHRARLAGPGRVQVELNAGGAQELDRQADPARHRLRGRSPLPGLPIDEQRIVASTGGLELERGADAPRGRRRGLHRAGARLGVAPARRQGHRGRVPRPRSARHGPRDRRASSSACCRGRAWASTWHQGHRRRRQRRAPLVTTEAAKAARPRDEGGRGAGRGRPAALHRGPGPRDASSSTTDNHGRSRSTASFATNAAGIYAIGDLIEGPDAGAQGGGRGRVVAEQLAGQRPHVDYDAIPAVIYTWPEVASVGQDRGAAQGGRASRTRRQVPVLGQRPGARDRTRPTASSRSWPTPRPTGCSASTSSAPTPAR